MSSKMASEGDLNAVVKEYLKFKGLEKSVITFEKECSEKGAPIASLDVKPKVNQKLATAQAEMLDSFDKGRRKKFFDLWTEHLEGNKSDEDLTMQKLEFYVNIHFAIYARRHRVEDNEEGMQKFKRYLETCAPALSRTAEFTSYYALPFVPEPETHSSYMTLFTIQMLETFVAYATASVLLMRMSHGDIHWLFNVESSQLIPAGRMCFDDEWYQDLRRRLDSFLKVALRSLPQPRLLDLYSKSGQGGSANNEAAVAKLEQRALECEKKAAAYMKRFSRVQTDYHNLIGITASLVDTLEESVQGIPVSPEYLQDICNKLFSSHVRQTTDFTRPGTAGKLLRQSVSTQPRMTVKDDAADSNRQLNYAKIKADLTSSSVHYRTRGLLLQALRWKLTKTLPAERNQTLAAYVSNDLLGCTMPGQYRRTILDLLKSDNDNVLLRQYMARLLNTFSSLCEGRSYLVKNGDLVSALLTCLQTETRDVLTRDNALGCLQKLSLRRQLQNEMIEKGVVNWLVKLFRDSDSVSDYMLEYAVALLMNLCLRTAGKQKCSTVAPQILKVLVELLGHDNKEILPYVNGTLYSILAVPNIRREARAMGLEDTLRHYMKDSQPEMNRQFDYIIKELHKSDDSQSDAASDDEDDDEEEDQDILEADLDKNELLKAHEVDLIGDKFLITNYSEPTNGAQRKKRPTDNVMAAEDVLRRPVTPSHLHHAPDFRSTHGFPSTRGFTANPTSPTRSAPRDEIQRPPTRSGSRPSSASNAIDSIRYRSPSQDGAPRQSRYSAEPKSEFAVAFNARPKIPRTPDGVVRPISRGSSSEGPPPQPKYSDSLPTPRPSSGGRLTGQPDKKVTPNPQSRQAGSTRAGAPVKTR